MAAGYSLDLHERVVAAIQEGNLPPRCSASIQGQFQCRREMEATGDGNRKLCGQANRWGQTLARLGKHQAWLLSQVAKESDLTLEEIRGRLAVEHAFKANASMLWRFFHRHRISFKKRCTPPNRIGRT